MQTKIKNIALMTLATLPFFIIFSCQKEISKQGDSQSMISNSSSSSVSENQNEILAPFNLEVILRGENNGFGHVKFRQSNDGNHIISLGVWVRDLEPNHSYLLQRAVDILDGNCTSTTWLTLGKGLEPQAITTNDNGTGKEELFRDVSAVPSGSTFDIHFQVIDAITSAVVLTSDCYQYRVR